MYAGKGIKRMFYIHGEYLLSLVICYSLHSPLQQEPMPASLYSQGRMLLLVKMATQARIAGQEKVQVQVELTDLSTWPSLPFSSLEA